MHQTCNQLQKKSFLFFFPHSFVGMCCVAAAPFQHQACNWKHQLISGANLCCSVSVHLLGLSQPLRWGKYLQTCPGETSAAVQQRSRPRRSPATTASEPHGNAGATNERSQMWAVMRRRCITKLVGGSPARDERSLEEVSERSIDLTDAKRRYSSEFFTHKAIMKTISEGPLSCLNNHHKNNLAHQI